MFKNYMQKSSVYSMISPLSGIQGVTTEKSTILSCQAQLELQSKKKVITTIRSAEFVIKVENFAY